jgi:hypothetical protein
MDILKLQKALLDWFWLEPNESKTFRLIDNVVTKLYEQYFPNGKFKNAKYEIFYPLMRYGVIEFYGDNSFGLSPSCALYNTNVVFCMNIQLHINDNIDSTIIYSNESLGITTYKKCSMSNSLFRKLNVPYSKFLFSELLNKISTFEKILNSWTDDTIIDATNYYFFNSRNTWSINNSSYINGVYKKGEENYTQRVIKISENKWKHIPLKEYNIDAFSIAVIWSQIQNHWDIGIKYFPTEKKIVIKNIFFPIVIERLLFINTLVEFGLDFNFLDRQYHINDQDFKVLNKLFDYKIEINE